MEENMQSGIQICNQLSESSKGILLGKDYEEDKERISVWLGTFVLRCPSSIALICLEEDLQVHLCLIFRFVNSQIVINFSSQSNYSVSPEDKTIRINYSQMSIMRFASRETQMVGELSFDRLTVHSIEMA